MAGRIGSTVIFRSVVLMFLLIPISVKAETVYVSDYLRVGVRPVPDSRVAPVNVVTTGMSMEVLQRKNGFLNIRADSGVEGWIKDTYAVSEKPAGLRLETLQLEHTELKEKHEDLEQRVEEAAQTAQALAGQIRKLKEENIDLHLQLVQEQDEGIRLIKGSDSWWKVTLVILAVFAAFALGVLLQRLLMRRRFGGLKL